MIWSKHTCFCQCVKERGKPSHWRKQHGLEGQRWRQLHRSGENAFIFG